MTNAHTPEQRLSAFEENIPGFKSDVVARELHSIAIEFKAQRDAAQRLLDSRTVAGWLRGPLLIGLPEESRPTDIPVFTFEDGGDLVKAAAQRDALAEALRNIENDDGSIPATIWAMRNAALATLEQS